MLDASSLDLAHPSLVAVSGGRDSVALLHLLRAHGCPGLVVCHLDHAARAESAADAEWVARLATDWGLPCVMERVEVVDEAGSGFEAAGRAERYRFFARAARARGVQRVYLGHHADDQVETFLLNLCRGSGAAGLGGMRPRSVRREGDLELELLRPLLGVWREEIDGYVREHALPFLEDPTNALPDHARNRLRHAGIPALSAALGRDVRGALWRAAEILQAEEEWMETATPDARAERLLGATIAALPLALQRRTCRAWLRSAGVRDVSYAEVESVRLLALQTHPARVNLPGGWHARRTGGELWIERPD